jgi:hypothetical protein
LLFAVRGSARHRQMLLLLDPAEYTTQYLLDGFGAAGAARRLQVADWRDDKTVIRFLLSLTIPTDMGDCQRN